MRGAATQAMSDIVEERQQRRYAPLRAAARRPAAKWEVISARAFRLQAKAGPQTGQFFRGSFAAQPSGCCRGKL